MRQKRLIIPCVLVLLYMVAGFFVLPVVCRQILTEKLANGLDRPVSIGKISVNPITLAIGVDDFSIAGKNRDPFISFDRLFVNASLASVFNLSPVVSEILLENPDIKIVRHTDNRFNFSDLIPQETGPDDEMSGRTESGKSKIPGFIVENIRIKGGSLTLADHTVEATHRVKDFSLSLPRISSKPKHKDQPVKTGISCLVNGAQVEIDVETTPFAGHIASSKQGIRSNGQPGLNPVAAKGEVHLSGLDVEKYTPYYESFLSFDVRSGKTDIKAAFSTGLVRDAETMDFRVDLKSFDLRQLILADRGTNEKMVELPELRITDSSIDSKTRRISSGSITAKNGKIVLKRMKNGRINLSAKPSGPPVNTSKKNARHPVKTSGKNPMPPWRMTLDDFKAGGFSLDFNDLAPQDPAAVFLSDINVSVTEMTSHGKDPGMLTIDMKWNKGGRVAVKGTAVPFNRTAELDLVLEQMDIRSLQPYFTDQVKIMVTSGDIHTSGKINLNLKDTAAPLFRFSGNTSVTDFVSLDKKSAKDFFKCNSLYFSDANISAFPVSVVIKDISLTDFYSRIIISDTGSLNLTDIFKSGPETDEQPAGAKEKQKPGRAGPSIRVDNITAQAGHVAFSDYLTEPNFTARMKSIAGSVAGLSSQQNTRAKLHLKGLHGDSSPLDIVGHINPLAKEKYADIDMTFKDIELSNFTPYAAKYLGYKIEKGKLILDLDYLIDGKKLTSVNKARFDNFTLGERVPSDHATSLPIALAVSLLKNRNGQIDLNLPVTGELDDPEFKIGTIVLRMITNLILKVVTSPFAVIGSMFGSGEDLGYTEFGFGETSLDDGTLEKLDVLGRILVEKPSVKLEVQGRYHLLKDTQALKMKAFEELLKAEKLKRSLAAGLGAEDLEDITVTAEERREYILAAYKSAAFPKPRNEAGLEKKLDPAEKKKLLITHIHITAGDLRGLAMNRSEAVKAHLISQGNVETERIFLLEPQPGEDPETPDKIKTVFLLK